MNAEDNGRERENGTQEHVKKQFFLAGAFG